ncbi:hypothetical protein B0H13DRAFT_1900307 [Mycena leptocephala]|nr:hypothetical protein B0H13DRAFT_1900307 [Mycena leptocephala]
MPVSPAQGISHPGNEYSAIPIDMGMAVPPLDDRSPRLQVDIMVIYISPSPRRQTIRRFIAFKKRSRRNMNNKPDVQQKDILTEATVRRAQTDFWLPPSSNAIGPESSRSATFKMPSTLLHLAWIRQFAVRWLTPPVVDVLGRGAYTSLTRAVSNLLASSCATSSLDRSVTSVGPARLANLPPPCRGVEACDPWAPAGPEIYQGGLNG